MFGEPVKGVTPVSPQGSNRTIVRIRSDKQTVIGVFSEDQAENAAFCYLARHFRSFDLRVPEIFGESENQHFLLLQDLGPATLFEHLEASRNSPASFPQRVVPLYRSAVRTLPRFQIVAGKCLDYERCYPTSSFDHSSMLADMRLFQEQYLSRTQISYDREALERDFVEFAKFLSTAESSFFLYRDFQSRNIVVAEPSQELGFIDFQGGRQGPLQYDLVSLLYQSRAQLPSELRQELLNEYLREVQKIHQISEDEFLEFYEGFVLVRLLQVLGRYGKLAFIDGKQFFRDSIPYAVANLAEVIQRFSIPCTIPALLEVCKEIPKFTALKTS